MYFIYVCVLVIGIAQGLQVMRTRNFRSSGNQDGQTSLRRILEALANTKLYLTNGDRRSLNPVEVAKAKSMYDAVAKSLSGDKYKQHNIFRSDSVKKMNDPEFNAFRGQSAMIEEELHNMVDKHTSALLHKAFIQKKGRNDFLVLDDSVKDPFVTVIPNNIYYNIEKKCVNWLDDCSLQGIRAKLLEKVKHPYK